MEIEQAARTAIMNIPGVSAIVEGRVYLDHRSQYIGDKSAVEVEIEDVEIPSVLDAAKGDGTAIAQMHIRCVSKLSTEVETLSKLFSDYLAGFRGDWSGLEIDAVTVADGESDKWEDVEDSSGAGVNISEATYEVRYQIGV